MMVDTFVAVVPTVISILGFAGSYVMIFMNRAKQYDQGLSDHFKLLESQLAAHILSDATSISAISAKLDMLIEEVHKNRN